MDKFLNESGYGKWNPRPVQKRKQRTVKGVKFVAVRNSRGSYVKTGNWKRYYHTMDLEVMLDDAIKEWEIQRARAKVQMVRHDDIDLLRDPDVDYNKIEAAVVQALADRICKCASCGKDLEPARVDLYDHEYGVELAGALPKKQWVSIHCPDCDYDTSLNKLRRV